MQARLSPEGGGGRPQDRHTYLSSSLQRFAELVVYPMPAAPRGCKLNRAGSSAAAGATTAYPGTEARMDASTLLALIALAAALALPTRDSVRHNRRRAD